MQYYPDLEQTRCNKRNINMFISGLGTQANYFMSDDKGDDS